MAQLSPFASFTVRILRRKIKSASRVIHHTAPSRNLGILNPPALNVISTSLWFELLDVVVGLACSSIIVLQQENLFISGRITLERALITMPLIVVNWLNNWPIGLKPNTELSTFCSHTFIVIISSWNHWLPRVLDAAIYGVSCLGLLGVSVQVSFATDVFQVATLHLRMCYVITTTVVYGLRLSVSTLWNLFQGKCYNQLCDRNDRWPYEMDHLVLGTIFFTLASFLMPTILIYYGFFFCIDHVLYVSFSNFDRCYEFLQC